MKFAHLADCHIGAWREPRLREVSIKAFIKCIDECLSAGVDFVLIAGDLFNTSLPSIDYLKICVLKLKELKQQGIPVYLIAGSHDFSPSGKTMLDVLEAADLVINVVKGDVVDGKLKLKFTIDPKTGAKITGMLGKRGMLERTYYENLSIDELENESGFKIFMFHTAITELKPKELEKMESAPISLLPKTFDYYAGGHVHIVEHANLQGYKNVIYPGPIFPNSFSEVEKLSCGGYYIYDDSLEGDAKISYHKLKLHEAISISLKCEHLSPEEIKQQIIDSFKDKYVNQAIITIKLRGVLESGKISDIDFKEIFSALYERGAYFVMKNTNQLSSKGFKSIKIDTSSVENVEADIIKEHLGQIKVEGMDEDKEKELTISLMQMLSGGKHEGEKLADFEKRVKEDTKKIFAGLNFADFE